MRRVLIIGLDAATFSLVRPWVDESKLPQIGRLMANGVWGNLKSTIPPITACAWSSFITGRRPGNTGIFDLFYREPGSYRVKPVHRGLRRGRALWQLLNAGGKKVGVINVPTTYPASEVAGFMVSCGLLAPSVRSKRFLYPEDLFDRHGIKAEDYKLRPEARLAAEGKFDKLQDELITTMRKRSALAEKLLANEPWDFFMVHFHATDWAEHVFWKYMDKSSPFYKANDNFKDTILKIYQEADEIIGKLLKGIDEETIVIIMSDHGQGPTYKYINTTTWLSEAGFLSLKKYPRFEAVVGKVFEGIKRNLSLRWKVDLELVAEKLSCFLPTVVKRVLDFAIYKAVMLIPKVNRIKPHYFAWIDWPKTVAYTIGVCGNIFINLRGREPKGAVRDGDEYRKVVVAIKDKLLGLKDKCGEQLIDEVYTKDEIYNGEAHDVAPDLVPVTEKRICYFNPVPGDSGVISEPEFWRSGNHNLNGIYIMTGPGVKKNQTIAGARIEDVAPTVLYALGLPIPTEMDGKPLMQCFENEYVTGNPVKFKSANKDEGDKIGKEIINEQDYEKLREELKGWGYVD